MDDSMFKNCTACGGFHKVPYRHNKSIDNHSLLLKNFFDTFNNPWRFDYIRQIISVKIQANMFEPSVCLDIPPSRLAFTS